MDNCVTILLVSVLVVIFIYYYCNKSNLLNYQGCKYKGDNSLNSYDP